MNESVLTEYVRRDLESLGYTTYAEVCFKGGGNIRCDMYARFETLDNELTGQTILFEAKLLFNLKVIHQCYEWKLKNAANFNYIIVPSSTHRDLKARKFAREICRLLGIGVMEVNVNVGTYQVTVKPVFYSNPKIPKLYEEQKASTASNSDNSFVTPFKITVKRINDYMEGKDRVLLTELVKNIKHHYKGDIKCIRNIRFNIEEKVIKGFYISKENNKLVVNRDGL